MSLSKIMSRLIRQQHRKIHSTLNAFVKIRTAAWWRLVLYLLLCVFLPLGAFCQSKAREQDRQAVLPSIQVVESSDRYSLNKTKPALHFAPEVSEGPRIRVDDSRTFQPIEGFGASLTDASAWLLAEKLSPSVRC